MTQEFMQDALAEDLRELFKDYTLKNSLGVERRVQVFCQDLPIREGDDEETVPEAPPEPYIIVRLSEGELPSPGEVQTAEAALVICVQDPARDRQGYRDAMHIVNAILHRYGANAIFGRRYEVLMPIRWAAQEDDTHPYYFAAVGMKVSTPALYKEVPEA